MPFYGDISEGLPVQLRAAVEASNSGLPSIRACFPNSIPPPNSSYNNTDQNAYQEQRDFQMSKAQSRSTLLSESSREHHSLSPLHSNGYLQHPTTVGTTNERMVGGLATSVINTVSGGRVYASKVFTQCMDRYPSTGTSYDQHREMVDEGGSCWGSLFQNVSSPSTIHTSCSPTMYTNSPHTSEYNVGTSETSDSGVNNMSNWASYQKDFPPKTQQQLPHNYNRPKNTSTILREGNITLSSSPTQNVKFSYNPEYTELLSKSHPAKSMNKSGNSSFTQNKMENSKHQELHAHRDLKNRLKEAVLSKQRQLEEQNEKQYQQQMQQIKQQVQQFNQQVQQHYRLQRMSFSNSATHDSVTDANIGSNTQVPYDEKPQVGQVPGPWCCRQGGTDTPTTQHLGDGCYHGIQTEDEQDDELTSDGSPDECIKKLRDDIEMLKNNVKPEIPHCDCFPSEAYSSEPGLYYTHLGAAASITDLRSDLETRTGVTKNALRIEKIVYTGKEGSTVQGCPLAKWIIRRESYDEKILCVVKHRKGHKCSTAWIVVVIVAWEGVSSNQADDVYNMLVYKLNRYGLPNTRRCATNKPRTCACQGLDPNTCGASFTFGCSWSMYYNSCKYVRSKTVRKFRLSVISEEEEIEDCLQDLATMLTPLYKTLAPQSFKYQTQFEHEASDCRLGLKPGRPFSGVTACVDFCAHSHRDFNNMNNGCTVVVTLTKHRALSKPADEQLHVLPLYVMDETDEFGSKEGQEAKARNGSIESLTKFPCEVRVRSVPLLSCKRQGKKRKEEANERKEHAMIQQGLKGTVQSTPTNRTTGIALAHTTKSSSLAFGNTEPGDENWGNHRQMADSNTETHSNTSSHEGRTSQSDSHLSHHHPSLNEHVHPEQNFSHQRDFNGKNSENKVKKTCGPLFSNQEINSDKSYENYIQAGLESTSCLNSLTKLPQSFESTNTSDVFNNSTQDIGIVSEIFDSGEQVRPVSVSSARDNMVRSPSNSYIFPQHLSMWPDQQVPLQTQQQEGSNYMYDSGKNTCFRDQKNCTSNIGDQNNSPNTFYSIQPEVPLSPSSLKHSQNPVQSNFEAISRQDFNSNTTDRLSYVDSPLYYSPIGSQQLTPISNSSPSLNSSTQDCLTELQCLSNTHNSLRSHPTDISNKTHCQGTSGQSSITSDTYTFSSFPITPTDLSMSSRSSHEGWVTPKKLHSLQNPSPYNSENVQWSSYMHTQVEPHSQSPNNLYSDSTKNKIDKSPSLGSVNTDNGAHFSSNTIGEVTDYIDNEESFKNLHIGGVAIALGHGSVLFECAKHELHATTALKRPNRLEPTRISLVFYQHRNLNRPKHGGYEWEEKMRLKKLGITTFPPTDKVSSPSKKVNIVSGTRSCDKALSVPKGLPPTFSCPTYPTTTWTTLFPMHPCILVGPYQLEDAKV
uniref:Methylcytosine dioxygenase TET n=1 Tax=Timema cristinae TaxID=61476 RepID=A0A7R9CE31_TIMCR|nr:unnamed protein product [Timema cristinae]